MPGINLNLGLRTYDLCDMLQVIKPQVFSLTSGKNKSIYSIGLLGRLNSFKYLAQTWHRINAH